MKLQAENIRQSADVVQVDVLSGAGEEASVRVPVFNATATISTIATIHSPAFCSASLNES
jgi:hypothetical protein